MASHHEQNSLLALLSNIFEEVQKELNELDVKENVDSLDSFNNLEEYTRYQLKLGVSFYAQRIAEILPNYEIIMHSFSNADALDESLTPGDLVIDLHNVAYRAKAFELENNNFIVGLDKAFDGGEFKLYTTQEIPYPSILIAYGNRVFNE